ncbi:hypothetical protein ACFE04_019197 [Oxalis oulophora]
MAANNFTVEAATPTEVAAWLKSMPLAPEYRPSLTEFQDPISYIFKIEKEASQFGICKIVPPLPTSNKKIILSNLNRSLAARASNSTFTTRQQQIGFCPRRQRPVQKPVWQSGETYTYHDFESKAKLFERAYLKKCLKKGGSPLSPLEIETLYWKATLDKPFSVEYANDMPGSAFVSINKTNGVVQGEEKTVGDTAWNMRGVSRAKGSLLKFMSEEIPGVTSPMVYLAMLFSWFAWHVEDHDLHSLNFLHMGASKTWYGVPKDAAVAFEDVVRVHGYNGEVNPLVTFATLGEKTTVISPLVFIEAGVPCCRLVQNPGEFVVTFPRAYHTGFSHGFNCGEAANIATPEWLRVAHDAAIRRASINYPPMVSHFQLLYDLALPLCSGESMSITASNPRSSRLRHKKKGEGGETLVKEVFVQNVIQNNDLLHTLGKGSSIVLLPQSVCSLRSQIRRKFIGSCSYQRDDVVVGRIQPAKGRFSSLCEKKRFNIADDDSLTSNSLSEKETSMSDQRVFSCVTCGILSFACVAIVEPREAAARYLMSADCSFFNDWVKDGSSGGFKAPNRDAFSLDQDSCTGWAQKTTSAESLDVQIANESNISAHTKGGTSALGLLAMTYGNCSDSDEDDLSSDVCVTTSLLNSSSQRSDHLQNSLEDENIDYVKSNRCQNGQATQKKDTSFPLGDEDSSRLHIFCLEHAIQAEEQLRAIGGANIILLCHPEYAKMEGEAKVAALELGIDHIWNGISFREATEEDEDKIKSALEGEEVSHGNGDWAVKLGVNLFYSANLSRSPLYTKQMPYNSIIYNAFGCSIATKSENNNNNSYGRKLKKVVAGKWCGKVWMSNQVHPFLVKRDPEELETNFQAPSGNHERKLSNLNTLKPQTRKFARKRKMTADTRLTKKVKRVESDYSLEDNDNNNTYNKFIETEDDEISNESIEEGNSHLSRRQTNDFSIPCVASNGNSLKQYKRRVPKGLKNEREDAILNSVVAAHSNRLRGRIPVTKLTNFTDADSDDDALNSRRITVTKQVKRVGGEFALSDESLEDYPHEHQQHRGIFTTNEDNFSDPQLSDDLLEDNCLHQYSDDDNDSMEHRKISGSKQGNFKEVSYDSLDDDDLLQQRTRKRQGKSLNTEDDEDSPEDNSRKQSISRKKAAKRFSPISDDSDDTSSRIPKSKVAKLRQVKKETTLSSRNEQLDPDFELGSGGPSTRLRKRTVKNQVHVETKPRQTKNKAKSSASSVKSEKIKEEGEYQCDMEGCIMSFQSKQELLLHKKNICPVKGCGKNFFSHKYLVQHRRVHVDDRPLKCPWKGCKMTFKWAWARTEHIRVHTGARPYVCTEPGCQQTFRFVSDFSRHKRKTGHSVKKGKN